MLTPEDLRDRFDRFEREHQLRVTQPARAEIANLINAVLLDAHETWSTDHANPDAYYATCVERLPKLLKAIAEANGLRQKITTLDVVYWLGRHLDDRTMWVEVCPFPSGEEVEGPLMWRGRFPWNLGRRGGSS